MICGQGEEHQIGMMNRISAVLAIAAVVPCLLAAGGFFSSFSLSDRRGSFSSGRHSTKEEDFIFPDEALPTKSGYFPVGDGVSTKMFYSYYESIEPISSLSETPLILWLQGGPGCSSMTGNFYEFGPWRTAPDLQLHKNPHPWNQRFGILFIDNPVGTGYSIAEKDEDIPTDQDQVVAHLYSALSSFFDADPVLKRRPFFIAGESYAGKYVPALGHHIMKIMERGRSSGFLVRELHQHGEMGDLKGHTYAFRLDGLIIGNGLTDPKVQVQTHAETAYNFGLIDKNQRAYVDELAKHVVQLVEKEEWYAAYKARTALVDWIQNVSGLATPLDVRRTVPYHCGQDGTEFLRQFLNRKAVKAALKAEDKAFWIHCNPRVRRIMAVDTMKSVKWMVDDLLPKLPLLLFQGQYDIKDGVASSEEWMRTLTWHGREAFFETQRSLWWVGKTLAGYWRSFDTLSHVVVVGAGHQVPADQGLTSQHMIEKWIAHVLSTRSSLPK
ncbi:hypothetical protein O6H91_14G018300 [Diphasiastrum complanatum]|uniref:Uncharacterized protein n=1 Tax=Diphasiastrum complanatum TaxID=34168 RepID=A0ACC2BLY9_DIPCM|nr:hypothetical protein O6H91_14G018300 [Diphasiastrum complanatum]